MSPRTCDWGIPLVYNLQTQRFVVFSITVMSRSSSAVHVPIHAVMKTASNVWLITFTVNPTEAVRDGG
jgi:hypothetical protein